MTRSITCATVTAALLAAGCGGSGGGEAAKQPTPSKQQIAQTQVCTARASIKKQVDTLGAMTASTVTVDGVKSSLQSIGNSVRQMKNAQGDLSGQRKQQVADANSAFKSTVQTVTGTLLKSLSLSDAKQQVRAAASQLEHGYQKALQPIDCGGS